MTDFEKWLKLQVLVRLLTSTRASWPNASQPCKCPVSACNGDTSS